MENENNHTVGQTANEQSESNGHVTTENSVGQHGQGRLYINSQFTSATSRLPGWASRGVRRARPHPEISSPSPWAAIQLRTHEVSSKNVILLYL